MGGRVGGSLIYRGCTQEGGARQKRADGINIFVDPYPSDTPNSA